MTEQSEGERLYILGHPVAHSKSPVMYNALYERLGLPWTYALADFAALDAARAFLDAREFLSVNITTPYKPLAFQAATRKAASAQLAQGANVLVRKDDQLIGFNTDGDGWAQISVDSTRIYTPRATRPFPALSQAQGKEAR